MERVVISNHCINTLSLRYFVSYVFGKPSNKATKVSSLKHLLCMIGFGKVYLWSIPIIFIWFSTTTKRVFWINLIDKEHKVHRYVG